MSRSSRTMYSAEEAYAILASDTESASEGEVDATFLYSSTSSSSSSSSSDEGPSRRRPRTAAEAAPQSDPVWTPPSESYQPQIPEFVASSGIQIDCAGFTQIDFFKIFFTEDFINFVVAQTNLYAQQFISQNPTSQYARPLGWTPVNAAEMMTFWGLVLHMGIVKKPVLKQYWSTDVFYQTPIYSMAMARTRFVQIHKFLHYNDNTQCPPQNDPTCDRLFKIRPVLDHFSRKFAEVYTPKKEICIDESLVHFKGRLKFRQYLPSKRSRYGIKMYKLCESTSGYTHRFRVYEGKDTRIEPPECPPVLSVSGKIVWDLLHPLLDKGYHLYVDNYYSSIPLFQSLNSRGTVACGTVRKNQRGLPRPLLGQLLRKGESRALLNENMLVVKYKDKRDVLVLTTIHRNNSSPAPVRGTTTTVPKPDCVLAYNKYMGGVDLSDQVLKPYNAMRKTKVWYKKLAVHIIQTAMYNAYVLFHSSGHPGTFLQFQEVVIKALIFQNREEEGPSTSGSHGARVVPGQHFPGEVPQTAQKGRTQKRCRMCSKRGIRKDTIYHCETCPGKPGLCIKDCFRVYHTSMQY